MPAQATSSSRFLFTPADPASADPKPTTYVLMPALASCCATLVASPLQVSPPSVTSTTYCAAPLRATAASSVLAVSSASAMGVDTQRRMASGSRMLEIFAPVPVAGATRTSPGSHDVLVERIPPSKPVSVWHTPVAPASVITCGSSGNGSRPYATCSSMGGATTALMACVARYHLLRR